MDNTIKLMKRIQEVLAGYDAKVLQSLIDSIPVRREALKAVSARWNAGEFKGQYATNYYASAQLEAVGGKAWRELLMWGNAALIEKLTKQEAAKAEARAAKVASVLNKAGIKEVLDGGEEYTNDGYNGWWRVETDQGTKFVRLTVIGAGGYNIQCYHYRVLTKIVSK